jgi:hypothetical protein
LRRCDARTAVHPRRALFERKSQLGLMSVAGESRRYIPTLAPPEFHDDVGIERRIDAIRHAKVPTTLPVRFRSHCGIFKIIRSDPQATAQA